MKIRASHILVATKEEAENLLLDIKNGVSFEDLAKDYSKCPSGRDGGRRGHQHRRHHHRRPHHPRVPGRRLGRVNSHPMLPNIFHVQKATSA